MFVRVTAPARLHFGLMQIDPAQPFCFSGLGLMLDRPALQLTAAKAKKFELECDDPDIAQRIFDTAKVTHTFLGELNDPKLKIRVDQPPHLHVGLGAGTQLACAVATLIVAARKSHAGSSMNAIDLWSDFGSPPHIVLATASGRGKRSHIGIAGFLDGGWIYDEGQNPQRPRSLRSTQRFDFPALWSILLFQRQRVQGLSGPCEQASFDRSQGRQTSVPAQMRSLALDTILPSVIKDSSHDFATSISSYNQLAGQLFANHPNTGLAGTASQRLQQGLHELGYAAVGQSSWGPTVWAIIDRAVEPSDTNQLQTQLVSRGHTGWTIISAAAANTGASVQWMEGD